MAGSEQCLSNQVYYIGGLVNYGSHDAMEIVANMELAVNLINNHSDGWFDSTRQVTLVLEVEDSECTREGGDAAARALNEWSINVSAAGTHLDGMVGAFCSDASIGASRFGNTIYATQISYASTSNALSDKDEYIYFARTCFADKSQGELLVNVLEDVGLVPYISVIASSDSYAQSLSQEVIDNYNAKGYVVLLEHTYTPSQNDTESYLSILDLIAASGSPVTVLVVYEEEVDKFMTAAENHPVYDDGSMVWVGIENWININGPWNKKGMVGLKPYMPSSSNITAAYMDLWGSLDPEVYHDTDGDRSSLATNTLYVADAVFSLAQAFQLSIEMNSGVAAGDDLKKYIFTVLVNEVSFTGEAACMGANSYCVFLLIHCSSQESQDLLISSPMGTETTPSSAFPTMVTIRGRGLGWWQRVGFTYPTIPC